MPSPLSCCCYTSTCLRLILYAYFDSYMPISGFHGVLSGFLVGLKQIIPDQELSLLKIKAKVWTCWKSWSDVVRPKTILSLEFNICRIYSLTSPAQCLLGSMQWLPSLALVLSTALSFFTAESAIYLPTLILGTYISWIYLRYWQKKPETKLRGDPSDEFAFSTFFPEPLRWISVILKFNILPISSPYQKSPIPT